MIVWYGRKFVEVATFTLALFCPQYPPTLRGATGHKIDSRDVNDKLIAFICVSATKLVALGWKPHVPYDQNALNQHKTCPA